VTDAEDGPLLTLAGLAPEHLGRALFVDLQARGVTVADIGTAEFRVFWINPHSPDRDAADHGPADAPRTEWFEQDHEPSAKCGIRR
jgi:hypothetical protein